MAAGAVACNHLLQYVDTISIKQAHTKTHALHMYKSIRAVILDIRTPLRHDLLASLEARIM